MNLWISLWIFCSAIFMAIRVYAQFYCSFIRFFLVFLFECPRMSLHALASKCGRQRVKLSPSGQSNGRCPRRFDPRSRALRGRRPKMQDGAFSSDGAVVAKAGGSLRRSEGGGNGSGPIGRGGRQTARRSLRKAQDRGKPASVGEGQVERRTARRARLRSRRRCFWAWPKGPSGRIGRLGARPTRNRNPPPIRSRPRSGSDDLRDVGSGRRRGGESRKRDIDRVVARLRPGGRGWCGPGPSGVRRFFGTKAPLEGLRCAARRCGPEGRAPVAKGAAALRGRWPGGGRTRFLGRQRQAAIRPTASFANPGGRFFGTAAAGRRDQAVTTG